MTKARLDGMYLLLLGSVVFLLLGTAAINVSPLSMLDFKGVYYGARCLIQHSDSYKESEILRVYHADGGGFPSDPLISSAYHGAITGSVYPPTTLLFLAPFALLAYGPAHLLWIGFTAGSLTLASLLILNLGGDCAPVLSGALIGFLLANSAFLLMVGNAAGIAISLCLLGVWCFLRERFIPLGVLCLAVSLVIKPQDAGLVWLYFLLAAGVYRKRALQTLLVAVLLSLPAILWISQIAPNWMQEWQSNLAAISAPGAINDPALAARGLLALNMNINLQSAICAFWGDPHIYNPVAYLLCAPLLFVWAFVTLRSRPSPARTWLALAAIASLSMLPVYHRQYDAKLLLLTIPACAMLWSEGGLKGRLALLVTAAGFVCTGDVPAIILIRFLNNLHLSTTGMAVRLLPVMWALSTPSILLLIGVFYLWVYMRHCSAEAEVRPL